jgi:hypothetical protein
MLFGGIIIQFFVKPLVIVFTAFQGSYSVVQGIDVFARTGFTQGTSNFLKSGGAVGFV